MLCCSYREPLHPLTMPHILRFVNHKPVNSLHHLVHQLLEAIDVVILDQSTGQGCKQLLSAVDLRLLYRTQIQTVHRALRLGDEVNSVCFQVRKRRIYGTFG